MRYLVTATMAASVLAIGLKIDPAFSLQLGADAVSPDKAIHKVQMSGKGKGEGKKGEGMGKGAKGDDGGAMRQGGGMRREGERSERRGQRGVEFGYRERDDRGDRPRAGERSRIYIERDRDRRRRGRGGIIIERERGYRPSCGWLRRRALATDSPYWWRRYRACRGW